MRKRILRTLVARGHLEVCDAKDTAERAASSSHGGGFLVDAGVLIEATDRAGLERLLRCLARPPFAMDRLKQRGTDLVFRSGKGHAGPLQSDKYSGELVLTPLEPINRIVQLVSPPRTHSHRCCGVLAPNSSLRTGVTAVAQVAQLTVPVAACNPVAEEANANADGAATAVAVAVTAGGPGGAAQPEPQAKRKLRSSSHYLWAALIARIYEVFPLICSVCGGQKHLIAFITFSADIHKILDRIRVETQAPCITPARGLPLGE